MIVVFDTALTINMPANIVMREVEIEKGDELAQS